jgi:hypothetical protein
MAKVPIFAYNKNTKTKRKGVHSKSKSSKLKTSRNYKKPYRGQGK